MFYYFLGFHSGDIKIYETLDGNLVNHIKAHDAFVTRLEFTNTGFHLVSASNKGTVKIISFTLNQNSRLVGELLGNNTSVNALAINESNVIITGSEDGLLRVYNNFNYISDYENEIFTDEYLDNPIEINNNSKSHTISIHPNQTLSSHNSAITACSFNSVGDKFASASKDASIIIWSISHVNYDCVELYSIKGAHLDWITDLKWSNSSENFLTASNDFDLKIWNANTGKECSRLSGHTANLNSCSFQFGCAVSTCYDGSIKVWSHKGNEISTLMGHQGRVNGCDLFVKLKLKNELKNDCEQKLDNKLWSDKVNNEFWSANHEKNRLNKDNVSIESVLLVTVSDDSTIRFWKPMESDSLASLENHNDKINSVELSKDGLLASASSDNSVNLWNMNNFFTQIKNGFFINKNHIKNHISEITSICTTKNGKYIFSTSFDGIMIVRRCEYEYNNNILSGTSFLHELEAHESKINKVMVLIERDDNIIVATCSTDKKVKIWSLQEDSINNSTQIKNITTLKGSNSVDFICSYNFKEKSYLFTVETDAINVIIRVYEIVDANIFCLKNKKGSCISNLNSIISNITVSKKHLYITLVQDEIIQLSFEEMLLEFKTFVNSPGINSLNNLKKYTTFYDLDNKTLKNSDMIWYTCIEEKDENVLAGDCKGGLYLSENTRRDNAKLILKMSKKCHNDRITAIITFGKKENKRILTASQDCTIKIWTLNGEEQLGQYNSTSGISFISIIGENELNNKTNFVFGDQMGYLHLIRFYDNIIMSYE